MPTSATRPGVDRLPAFEARGLTRGGGLREAPAKAAAAQARRGLAARTAAQAQSARTSGHGRLDRHAMAVMAAPGSDLGRSGSVAARVAGSTRAGVSSRGRETLDMRATSRSAREIYRFRFSSGKLLRMFATRGCLQELVFMNAQVTRYAFVF